MRFLVIEDEEGMGLVLEAKLGEVRAKFPSSEIVLVRTLADGLRVLAQIPKPDVIFLDLGLPDSEWQTTLSAAQAIDGEAPVIIITGHAEEKIREILSSTSPIEIIHKSPDMWGKIIGAIARALQRGRDRAFAEIDDNIRKLREMIDHAPPLQ